VLRREPRAILAARASFGGGGKRLEQPAADVIDDCVHLAVPTCAHGDGLSAGERAVQRERARARDAAGRREREGELAGDVHGPRENVRRVARAGEAGEAEKDRGEAGGAGWTGRTRAASGASVLRRAHAQTVVASRSPCRRELTDAERERALGAERGRSGQRR
jgi:hypothetical protein